MVDIFVYREYLIRDGSLIVVSWLISNNQVDHSSKDKKIIEGKLQCAMKNQELLYWNIDHLEVNHLRDLRGHKGMILVVNSFP
jgi:hypothetical protein